MSTGAQDNTHNDLLPHNFLELLLTTISLFQQTVLKWQWEYLERAKAFTPYTFITMADEKCQVLEHSHHWVGMIDLSMVAMQRTKSYCKLVHTTLTQGNAQ
jgi:hypothetical protein